MSHNAVRLFAGFSLLAAGCGLLALQLILTMALPPEEIPVLGSALTAAGIVLACSGLLNEDFELIGALAGLALYVAIGVGLLAYDEGGYNLPERLAQPRVQVQVLSWPSTTVVRFAATAFATS